MSIKFKLEKNFWLTLAFSLIFGASVSLVVTILLWSNLLDYRSQLILNGSNQVTVNREDFDTFYNAARERVEERASPAVAHIFLSKDNSKPDYFLPQDSIARGIVYTSDGWIISHKSVVDPRKVARLWIAVGPFVLKPERAILDEETGVLFLKVNATNLRAAEFGDDLNIKSGDEFFAVSGDEDLNLIEVKEPRILNSKYSSSDLLESKIGLGDFLNEEFGGGPLVNPDGKVIGILLNENGEIKSAIPVSQISSFLDKILRGQKLIRPTLGVNGINISGGWSGENGRTRGFLITNNLETGARAVLNNSPASRAGLLSDDVILKLKDTTINNATEIAETILSFNSGETINAEILRAGENLNISITLGEREVGKEY